MDAEERKALEKREARRWRRLEAPIIIMTLALALLCATAVVTWKRNLLAPTVGVAIMLLLLVIAVVAGALALTYSPNSSLRGGTESRRDREQRARIAQMVSIPASSLALVILSMVKAQDVLAGDHDWGAVAMAVMGVLYVALIGAMVMNWDGGARKVRKFLEDELTREYRARALTCGFWVLLPGTSALYLFGLWRPEDAIVLFPIVLWAGAATAALRFAQLHRRAEREMGDDG